MLILLLMVFLESENHFDILCLLHIWPSLSLLGFHVQDSDCGLSVILSNGHWKEL